MANTGNTPPRPPRKRRRPAVVCAECRRRKIACDRKTPCGQCALHKVECVYVTGAMPPPYGRPLPTPVGPRSQMKLPVPAAGPVGTGHLSVAAAVSGHGKTTASPLDDDDHGDGESNDGRGSTPGTAGRPGIVERGDRSSRFGGRLVKTRFLGRSHWMNNMDEFEDIHALTPLLHSVSGSAIDRSMRACKCIGRSIKADKMRRITTPAEDGDEACLAVPPRAVCDRLLDLYFNVYEPHFRILHMPTFRREYGAFMDLREAQRAEVEPTVEDKDEVFMVKLALVLALGSCFYNDTGDPAVGVVQNETLRIAAARAVRKMGAASCVPLNKSSINLGTLQIYCLVTLARQTSALDMGDDITWFSAGGLLHMAFGMGLNRDPSHFQSLSFAQAEMRRRLWATVLELAVQSSLDQGMPPLISADDYDCAPPLNLDDDEFDLEERQEAEQERDAAVPFRQRAVPRKGRPEGVFTHTTMQRLLCRSLPVRLRIAKALNGLGTGLTYDRALQLSTDLLEACRYMASTLRAAPLMTTTRDGAPAAGEHAAYARLRICFFELLTRRFHHALHAPFARKAHRNVQFYFSRRARIETALRLLSFCQPATTASGVLPAAEDPCRRLWLIGRGMLKCTMIDIKATAVIEMIHQLQEDYVPGADLTLSQRELYDMVRSLAEIVHARIEAGETNVKAYLFFRAALAQVDALIEGRPVRQALVDTTRLSSRQAVATLAGLALRKGVVLPAGLGGVDSRGGDTLLDPPPTSPAVLNPDDLGAVPHGGGSGSYFGPGSMCMGEVRLHSAGFGNGISNIDSSHGSTNGSGSISTTNPAPGQLFSMTDLSSVTLSELERSAQMPDGMAMHTHMAGGSGGSISTDIDSAIHLPSTADMRSTITTSGGIMLDGSGSGGSWVDECVVDAQGDDADFSNWFFPFTERIGIN